MYLYENICNVYKQSETQHLLWRKGKSLEGQDELPFTTKDC